MAKSARRPRNAEATREAITQAARRHFIQKGYDQVGLREIARDAGVDAAMINRYFGSKEGLFEEAIVPLFNIDMLIADDFDRFAARAAAMSVDADPAHKRVFDSNRALLLSIANAEIRPKISEALSRTVIAPLADRLGGDQPELRATFIVAMLLGFDALHRIARLDVLTSADRDMLGSRLGGLIACIMRDKATP